MGPTVDGHVLAVFSFKGDVATEVADIQAELVGRVCSLAASVVVARDVVFA